MIPDCAVDVKNPFSLAHGDLRPQFFIFILYDIVGHIMSHLNMYRGPRPASVFFNELLNA